MLVMAVREKTLAGRYRLEEVIGRGGMSTVYRGSDDLLGRTVAVKILLAALVEQDPAYAARFEREARAAAALASSTVVTVYDTGTDEDGSQYIVMEYVAGLSLAQLLADGRPLEISQATRIGERVADALRVAHAAGILHRDIKPANVMVASDGTVKVLDFGIARRLDGTTLTQSASVVGTAAYMAPERALGQPGDARSDVYSLGCLLYAMLTGSAPFTGELAAALLHQQVNSEPRPPSELRAGIPAALDSLVLQMLAKEPDARPQSATQVRDRLLSLSGVSPLFAAAGVTAATAPLTRTTGRWPTLPMAPLTATTKPLRRSRPALAAALADHRWRALVMALATALVALAAIALIAWGGGSGTHSAVHSHRAAARRTTPATTKKPAKKAPKQGPAKSKPKGPPGHGGEPPGHGGQPPGHGGQGGDGGDGGGD
jgi:serine/threonine-protein kinase